MDNIDVKEISINLEKKPSSSKKELCKKNTLPPIDNIFKFTNGEPNRIIDLKDIGDIKNFETMKIQIEHAIQKKMNLIIFPEKIQIIKNKIVYNNQLELKKIINFLALITKKKAILKINSIF